MKVENVVKSGVQEATVTLNREELQVLQDIFCKIGGHPENSRRSIVDGMSSAIFGMDTNLYRPLSAGEDMTDDSGIYFKSRG